MAAACFHQKQFLPYARGAPNIRSLSSRRDQSHVLVTTDRSVAVVQYDAASHEYALQELALESFAAQNAEVIASGVIECPEREAIAIAYAEDEKLFLEVVAADELLRISKSAAAASSNSAAGGVKKSSSTANTALTASSSSSIRFELVSAPTTIMSVKALSTTGAAEIFHGVILFRADSMAAFGFVDAKASGSVSADTSNQCARLSSEQFAAFFPEFESFTHPVLAVDTVCVPQCRSEDGGSAASAESWIAFGCADGFVRVFRGTVQDGCSCGPYDTRDFQIDGPVTSVSLFATVKTPAPTTRAEQMQCNLLATCAIGHALVYEDVFSGGGEASATTTELLVCSDHFDSIFAGIAADIDLDGHVELLLGTDDQQLLAYKRTLATPTKQRRSPRSTGDELSVDTKVDDNAPSDHVDELDPLRSSLEAVADTEDAAETPVDPESSALLTEAHTEIAPQEAQAAAAPPPPSAPLDTASVKEEERTQAVSNWSPLAKTQWHVEAFGAIYSVAWLDLNRDGVDELLVASATGVFVYEADAQLVLQKLRNLLQLSSSSSASEIASEP